MTLTQQITDQVLREADEIMESHQYDVSRLLEMLLEVQKHVEGQYIPKEAAYYMAEKLKIKVSRIYDVISFFSALHTEPRAKYPIQVCESVVCKINEADSLINQLRSLLEIEIGQTTYDGRFTLEKVACFGACDKAPAVRINGKVYGPLTSKEQVEDLLKSFI